MSCWPISDIGYYGQGHLWSLAIEEQFYLVWPLIVFSTDRRGLRGICWLAVAGALLFRVAVGAGVVPGLRNIYAPLMLTPARMDVLGIGGLLALAVRAPAELVSMRRWARPAAASLLALLVVFFLRVGTSPFDARMRTLGFTLIALFLGAVLALTITASSQRLIHRVLAHRSLRMFGRSSYALYLFHLQINAALLTRCGAGGPWSLVLGSEIPVRVAFTLLGIACSVPLAWLSWHLYESRFLALKRFFPYGDRST
jgi:peptidoglycan/LPS O-acetylase OafA/YrhL